MNFDCLLFTPPSGRLLRSFKDQQYSPILADTYSWRHDHTQLGVVHGSFCLFTLNINAFHCWLKGSYYQYVRVQIDLLHTTDVEATGFLTLMEHRSIFLTVSRKCRWQRCRRRYIKHFMFSLDAPRMSCPLHMPKANLLRAPVSTLTLIIQHLLFLEPWKFIDSGVVGHTDAGTTLVSAMTTVTFVPES
jgi:hypothetical protein